MTLINTAKILNRLVGTLLGAVLLAGCAAGGSGVAGSESAKIGMHIDAQLGFAIEYPLDWKRQRLLYRSEDRGEIRWTPPGADAVQLVVISQPLDKQVSDRQTRLAAIMARLPGFEATLKEDQKLPGGEALHVMGYTARLNYDLLLLESPHRTYTIQFSAPPEDFGQYEDQLEDIIDSFIPLENAHDRTRTDS